MSSKLKFAIPFLALTLLAFGCADRGPTKNSPAGPNAACLEQVPAVAEKYFDGKSSAEEISAAWNCADSAIVSFINFTAGQAPGRGDSHNGGHEIRGRIGQESHVVRDLGAPDAGDHPQDAQARVDHESAE